MSASDNEIDLNDDEEDILDKEPAKITTAKAQPPVQQPAQVKSEEDNSNGGGSSDILGSLADLGLRFFLVLVVAMLDCLEQTFANMSYASGKNFKWVLLIVFTYIPVSILSPLFGYRSCITWQDACIAFIVTFCLFAINGINKASINSTVSKIKEVSSKVKEVGGRSHGNKK